MTKILQSIYGFLWGVPALVLILGVGLYLTFRTSFAQFTLFPAAIRDFFGKLFGKKQNSDGVSSFQALCTALAATVGTGNLVGVAGAICIGGPGSIFWMWICGILGMVTKFAEVTLAVRYRTGDPGNYAGGPMYMISRGMGSRWKFLGVCYSFFGIVAAFGVGNATQINAVITGINGVLNRFGGSGTRLGNFLMGLILAVLVGALLFGGAKRIGRVAEGLVPVVSAAYILLCLFALIFRAAALPGALRSIVQGAFSPKAATGGMIGSAFQTLRVGCSRGVFTNEAGMGTASMAHAGAETHHPVQQGMMGIVEVFLDTILICTLTALVILTSGVPISYGVDMGGELTMAAFTSVFGDWVSLFLAAALSCFAFATVLGWGLYGIRCAQFLFGDDSHRIFVLLQTLTVLLSAMLQTGVVWLLAETVNGLMAIPNLIALAYLSPELVRLTKQYKRKPGRLAANGGYYADFHQCKPL